MKKVLFATTALVLTAGVAAAEVAVTGDARIGLRYDSDNACDITVDATCPADGTRSTWNVVNRARVKFSMTGESDAGLSFGAELRADNAGGANRGDAGSGTAGKVWVSGSYGKLTAGDIDSAMESAVGDLPEVGLTGLNFYNELTYLTSDQDDAGAQDDAGLLYEYAINGVKVFASFHDQYYGQTGNKVEDNAWSIGAQYDMAGYNFGLGYEDAGDVNHWGLSAGGEFAGAKVKAVYTRATDDATDTDADQYGLGAEYAMANGVNLSGFWRHVEIDPAAGDSWGTDYLGLGAGYDLGGGATVKGGIVNVSSDNDADDETLADFGLEFKF